MVFNESINFEIILFQILTGLLISSAFLVILSKNPVHSVLFLILAFVNSTALLLLCKIEFISIILVIIYVGAIAVLFLFVVMMLDINIVNQSFKDKLVYFPISFFIFFMFLSEILMLKHTTKDIYQNNDLLFNRNDWLNSFDFISNTETISQVLYTYYFIYFLIAGIILLIALLGAVSLTLRKNKKYNQKVFKQLSRSANNSIFNYI